MKKFLTFVFVILSLGCFSQGTWTQKDDFGGTGRFYAAGFSIGTKGYIGTGQDLVGATQDFWEYDQATNTWTQKASLPGGARVGAVGFSIGTKGYIGTGSGAIQDFWEYDQTTNTWTQKANFPGVARVFAVGFSIGTKGYIGTGQNDNGTQHYQDFWEYDQATNTWIQKANFAGVTRSGAVGFSIGTKGYIGTGRWGINYKDFWEYDPFTDLWSSKTDFGGTPRHSATGFSIGSKGYIGTGQDGLGNTQDFWEYNPVSNVWIQKANFGGISRFGSTGFSIGAKGYIGVGSASGQKQDFWEFNSFELPICLVTVDSTSTKNLVIWEKPTTAPIDSFKIYREIASVYTHIASVPYSAQSVFTDTTTGVNPNTTAYKYEISVLDTCGNESALSSYHRTIHVSISPASPCGYNLHWNDYVGFPVTQYLIYRDSSNTGWLKKDSVSFGNVDWTDFICYTANDTIAYLVEAVNPAGCILSKAVSHNSTRSNVQKNFSIIDNVTLQTGNDFNIKIYPNPTNGKFTLVIAGSAFGAINSAKQSQLSITNALGEVIFNSEITGESSIIDLSNQPSGMYIVCIRAGTKVEHRKLLKE